MVPKLHAKGKSFKGAAAYLLHDKERAKTAKRLAWTETRNLATENPHVAWKVMAATAMDQERLKEQAGVKKTGRKSPDCVLHFTLSWHPDEKKGLSRAEMTRAANGAIRALSASDRQAVIICHDDEPQPHVHILLNRIGDDGRMLSSSKEKLALSAWAEKYERERGEILCEQRAINNAARKRKEFTRAKRDEARRVIEAMGPTANDNDQDNALRQAQRAKDAIIAARARALKERQEKKWQALERGHKDRIREAKTQAARDRAAQISAVRETRRPDWTQLFRKQETATAEFEKRERTFLGKFKNILGAVDLKAIIQGRSEALEARSRKEAISEAFQALSSAGARLEALKRQQEAEKRTLQAAQKREEDLVAKNVRAAQEQALRDNRKRYEEERNDLILAQSMDGAKLRAERMERGKQREHAWEEHRSGGRSATPGAPSPRIDADRDHAADRFERPHGRDHIERDRFDRGKNDRSRDR